MMQHVEALRAYLDPNTPIVFEGGWDRLNREGWRFCENLCLIHASNIGIIKERVKIHGPLNVAIGHFFDKEKMKPRPEPAWCGLYVRDLDIVVEQFSEVLEDDEALARWLSGKNPPKTGEVK